MKTFRTWIERQDRPIPYSVIIDSDVGTISEIETFEETISLRNDIQKIVPMSDGEKWLRDLYAAMKVLNILVRTARVEGSMFLDHVYDKAAWLSSEGSNES